MTDVPVTAAAGEPELEPPVTQVLVRIRRADGSQQEITANWPEPFLLRIGAKDEEAGLSAGMTGPDRKEPLIAVLFGGNAGVGGVRVNQTGIKLVRRFIAATGSVAMLVLGQGDSFDPKGGRIAATYPYWFQRGQNLRVTGL